MSIEVISEHSNPLLHRKDAKLIVHHDSTGTPDRSGIKKIGADHFKTQPERVYVRSVKTRTGGSSAICHVEIYDDTKFAERIVPAYIKNRNLPIGQRISRKKGEEEKPAPAAAPKPAPPEKKAETPKQAPPKEVKPPPTENKTAAKTETKPAPKASSKPESKPKS